MAKLGLGKILGSFSPAFGMATGKGLFGSKGFKDVLGTLSPMMGMMTGHGAGGDILDMALGMNPFYAMIMKQIHGGMPENDD